MKTQPDLEQFIRLAAQYDRVPVYRRLLADSLTPVSAFHALDTGGTACLFESVIGGEKVGRYSFLAVDPVCEVSARQHALTVRAGGTTEQRTVDDPIEELRQLMQGVRVAPVEGLTQPFKGGAIGYAGYDMVRYSENLPNAPEDDRQLPDLAFAFYDRLVVFDNVTKSMSVVSLVDTSPFPRRDLDETERSALRQAYDRAQAQIQQTIDRLESHDQRLPLADIASGGQANIPWTSNFQQEDFQQAVRRCVEYIRAGDIFQVVISQRLAVPTRTDPFEIYRTLRVINPSPFMFFLRTPDVTLVGSSPEIMCRVIDGKLTVRPLAGTRPRGETEQEDNRLAAELLADPKERAEHVMLVDLGRNDVGRVARYGSVELTDVMSIERYSHVMHITSNVTGQLATNKDAFDALRACVPAGTVSGAPKVRAMQIIDELEPHRRGPYAGAVGYIDYGGNMDTCIALRTLVVKEGVAYVQAGAGIVADSDPASEYQETLNKAQGLLRAIELTEQRLSGQHVDPPHGDEPSVKEGTD